MRRGWELLRLAVQGVARAPLRASLTAAGVAIAVGALISMVGFAVGLQARIEEPFAKLEMLHRIEVRVREADGARLLDDEAIAALSGIPGVVVAYPDVMAPVRVAGHGAIATGLPPAASALPSFTSQLIAGGPLPPGPSDAAILSEGLARTLKHDPPESAVGTTVEIEASGLSPAPGAGMFSFASRKETLRVVGVWRSPWPGASGFDAILLPLDTLRTLPGAGIEFRRRDPAAPPRPGPSSAVVRVGKPSDLAPVQEAITELGFHARTLLDQARQMRTAFILFDLLLAAVGTVALVVAGLGIVNTLLVAVLERRSEIGTLKALGASDGDVRLLFLLEAGLVGLSGGVLGVGLGRAVSWAIGAGVNRYAASRGVTEAVAAFEFPAWLVLGAVVFAVLASVVSGLYPASRAARVDPIRALRGE